MNIVKVKYGGEGREYSYFSEDPLALGDVVQVPVHDRITKATVTAVDVPESEIEAFKDKVKTIPAGSKYVVIPEGKPGDDWKETRPQAPPPAPDRVRTGQGTQGFQKVYKWEVVDKTLVPLDYLTVDTAKVAAVVKASKGTISIPGIRTWEDETVRVNTK